MKEQGVQQNALAAQTGIPKSTMSYYTNGKLAPTAIVKQKIADVLNVSVEALDAQTPEESAIATRGCYIHSAKEAAKILGVNAQGLRQDVINGLYPFARAFYYTGGKKLTFRFHIKQMTAYIKGQVA